MQNYHALMEKTLNEGSVQFNKRTGISCRVLVGGELQYDMKDGFPAITTKKLAFNTMKGELLGFFRGYDNAAKFRELGCGIWDQNANETKDWLASPYRRGHDDLGRIYGVNWTAWRDSRVANSISERNRLLEKGYEIEVADVHNHKYAMIRTINQLERALTKLLTNPSDRRIIISGWNVAELEDQMALPPCHMDYRFIAFEDTKELSVVMTIRSWDLFLGAPFNIGNTSLFLAIMARLSGYTPKTVVIQAANAHIYQNHEEQVMEQLKREHFDLPKLVLSDNIKQVSLDEVKGAFERINPEDIYLEDYQSHASIKAPMAA